tara:strand:- start:6742 stop:7962 length:1221 start_codon:yes stop_codon:yes gene_type:complete
MSDDLRNISGSFPDPDLFFRKMAATMSLTAETVKAHLATIMAPDSDQPITAFAELDGIAITPDAAGNDSGERQQVQFSMIVDPALGPRLESIRQLAEQSVAALPGVSKATAILTAPKKSAQPQQPPVGQRPANPGGEIITLPGVKHIIAVASGKGGVGKSTVAANLAASWAELGWSVGLMDADIYGPSVPTMMGQHGKPELTSDKRIRPVMANGLKTMSIGYLTEPEKALVWRGPMVQGALMQMLRDVDWGELDVLVIDMPPGTGDAQLTLAQKLKLTGAIVVSTPQDLALIDARRGIAMFERVAVPVLGIIENMSVFTCPHCGEDSHIFGHGGAVEEAKQRGIPLLGQIPLTMSLREQADAGQPLVGQNNADPAAKAFLDIAVGIRDSLTEHGTNVPKAPTITWL